MDKISKVNSMQISTMNTLIWTWRWRFLVIVCTCVWERAKMHTHSHLILKIKILPLRNSPLNMNNIIRTAGHTQSPRWKFPSPSTGVKVQNSHKRKLTTSAVSDERGATEPNHLQALKTGFQNNAELIKREDKLWICWKYYVNLGS